MSSLLNEPIEGHGLFWSSAKRKPIPIPIRALSFEAQYKPADPDYRRAAAITFASELKDRFAAAMKAVRPSVVPAATPPEAFVLEPSEGTPVADEPVDALETYSRHAIEAFRNDTDVQKRLRNSGMPWRGVLEAIKKHLPDIMDERDKLAHDLVQRAMTEVFGQRNVAWKTEKRESKTTSGGFTTWVVIEHS